MKEHLLANRETSPNLRYSGLVKKMAGDNLTDNILFVYQRFFDFITSPGYEQCFIDLEFGSCSRHCLTRYMVFPTQDYLIWGGPLALAWFLYVTVLLVG